MLFDQHGWTGRNGILTSPRVSKSLMIRMYRGVSAAKMAAAFEEALRLDSDAGKAAAAELLAILRAGGKLHAETTLEFSQTKGEATLVVVMNGSETGRVQSSELCSAFFNIYLGEDPITDLKPIATKRLKRAFALRSCSARS